MGRDVRFNQHDPDLMSDSLSSPVLNVTTAMHFALLLCSANQACPECCVEVTAVRRLSHVSWATWLFPPRLWRDHPTPWLALANPGLPPNQRLFYSKTTGYPQREQP